MVKVAVAFFVLPDGRLILQRRDDKAKVCPNMLGPFGGHFQGDEKPEAALRRELGEETSLNLEPMDFKYLFTLYVTPREDMKKERTYVFLSAIQSPDFEIYEGRAVEVYPLNDLVLREDLTPIAAKIVDRLVEGKHGS